MARCSFWLPFKPAKQQNGYPQKRDHAQALGEHVPVSAMSQRPDGPEVVPALPQRLGPGSHVVVSEEVGDVLCRRGRVAPDNFLRLILCGRVVVWSGR